MTSAHKLYGPGLDGDPVEPIRLDPAREPCECMACSTHLRRRPFAELMSRLSRWLRWR